SSPRPRGKSGRPERSVPPGEVKCAGTVSRWAAAFSSFAGDAAGAMSNFRHAGLRLEGLVDFDLVSAGQAVGFIRHADHGHEFGEHGVRHARLARRGGVRGDAIGALVGGAYGHVD